MTGLKQPIPPAFPVAHKFKKKNFFVTAMGNVPDMVGEKTAISMGLFHP